MAGKELFVYGIVKNLGAITKCESRLGKKPNSNICALNDLESASESGTRSVMLCVNTVACKKILQTYVKGKFENHCKIPVVSTTEYQFSYK